MVSADCPRKVSAAEPCMRQWGRATPFPDNPRDQGWVCTGTQHEPLRHHWTLHQQGRIMKLPIPNCGLLAKNKCWRLGGVGMSIHIRSGLTRQPRLILVSRLAPLLLVSQMGTAGRRAASAWVTSRRHGPNFHCACGRSLDRRLIHSRGPACQWRSAGERADPETASDETLARTHGRILAKRSFWSESTSGEFRE
jgi:hypothetical protein